MYENFRLWKQAVSVIKIGLVTMARGFLQIIISSSLPTNSVLVSSSPTLPKGKTS